MKWLAVVALVGCGRMGFDSQAAGPDAAALGSGSGSGPCVLGPWTPTRQVFAADTYANELAPALSADGLTLIFETDTNFTRDLYISTRPSTSDPFGVATPLAVVNSQSNERDPTLSMDGLTLYFTSDRTGSPRLYRATRATATAPFEAPTREMELSTIALAGPSLSADGHELFYSDVNETVLIRATYTPQTGFVPFGQLDALGGYASAGPSLSGDGLTIFYRHKTDLVAAYDIYYAERPALGMSFGAPMPLTELNNAQYDDGDPEISKDGKTLVFVSNRPGGVGGYDLYMTTRDCM